MTFIKSFLRITLVIAVQLLFAGVCCAMQTVLEAADKPSRNVSELNTQIFENAQKSVDLSKLKVLAKTIFSNREYLKETKSFDEFPQAAKSIELINCMRKADDECFNKKMAEFSAEELTEPAGQFYMPLYYATDNGHLNYVKFMLEAGANPNASTFSTSYRGADSFHVTPILYSVLGRYIAFHSEVDFELISANKKKKDQTDYSKNPFELKAPKKKRINYEKKNAGGIEVNADTYFAIINLLIKYGADINLNKISYESNSDKLKQNTAKSSVLFQAVFRNSGFELIEYLVKSGADVNFVSQDGRSKTYMTQIAIANNDARTLDILVKNGADTKIFESPQKISRPLPAINRWLYDNGFDLNEFQMLPSAIFYNDIDFVGTLLKDKLLDIHFIQQGLGRDNEPLKMALFRSDLMFEKLLKAGADPCYMPNKKMDDRTTVFQLIRTSKRFTKRRTNLLYILLKHKPNSTCYTKENLEMEISNDWHQV